MTHARIGSQPGNSHTVTRFQPGWSRLQQQLSCILDHLDKSKFKKGYIEETNRAGSGRQNRQDDDQISTSLRVIVDDAI